MKTRNTLKTVALAIAVIFAAGTVNATEKATKASSHENIIESSIYLESWMINDALWNTSAKFIYTQAQDASLVVETWMTNSDVWSISNDWVNQVNEASLEVECWMTDEFTWELSSDLALETEKEADLTLENWMVNDHIWRM